MSTPHRAEPIAIVGLAARLPGGPDVAAFWDALLDEAGAIATVPPARWDWRKHFAPPGDAPDTSYSTVGGFIDHVDCFDWRHFGISPREAESMEPMQRLFLQAVWTALEDAGIAPRSLSGRKVGVFAGVGSAEYVGMMRAARCANDAYRATGMALTLIANRVSYLLNLRGPSQVIDTACSSSLVALHRAAEQLRLGTCELAVAGGISLMLTPELHIAFSQAGMLSVSGHCRPFDANADGYVRGEGVGVVVLKRLEDAMHDGDFVYATLLASAENHGGRAHSLTAPSFKGQAEVLDAAWRAAGPALASLSYLETHGTGTPLGDPIEIAGIVEALRNRREEDSGSAPAGRIHLGAVKSRIGHLEAASGIASVIKTVLALQHRLLPSNVGFSQANSQLDFGGEPLQLVTEPLPWDGEERIAGVSSFGFGGVNAHVVLQSAAPADFTPGEDDDGESEAFILSAKDDETLLARARQLLDYLYPGIQARVLLALAEEFPGDGDEPSINLDTPWSTSGTDAAAFAARLTGLARRLDLPLGPEDVRDCLSWGDVSRALGAMLPMPALQSPRLPSRASLSRHDLAPSLRGIAASLFLGRDLHAHRLAIPARSISELAFQLAFFLAGHETPRAIHVVATRKTEDVADGSFPGWRDVDALARWLQQHASTPRLADELAARYQRGRGCPRVPLPTLPLRLEHTWFKRQSSQRAEPTVTPPTHTWDVAPLQARWAERLQIQLSCVPSILPWPAHFAAAEAGIAFEDVRWGQWPPGPNRLSAELTPSRRLRYYAGRETATTPVLEASPAPLSPFTPPPAARGADDEGATRAMVAMPWLAAADVTAVDAGPDWIDVGLAAIACENDVARWSAYAMALVQGLQLLFRDAAAHALLLPYRAARLQLASAITQPPERILLRYDARSLEVDAWVLAADHTMLEVRGMEVRAAPWAARRSDATADTTRTTSGVAT